MTVDEDHSVQESPLQGGADVEPGDITDMKPEASQFEIEGLHTTFSKGTRCYLTYLLGFIMVLSTLTATIYFPLIPLLSSSFSSSTQAINLTVTVYAIVQAISPGIFASLADTFGRRPVLLILLVIYTGGSLGLVFDKGSYAALMTLRALQSLGGSPIPAIAYGIVADVATVAERGKMLGPMLSTCNGISAIGPVAAGAAAFSTGGYIWIFVVLLVIAVVSLLATGFTVPETCRAIVRNGSVPATGVWRTWSSLINSRRGFTKAHVTSECDVKPQTPQWTPAKALKSLRIIIYPDAAAILWMVGSSYCVYYTFQVAIPTIFDEVYAYNELYIGLAFLPGLAGMTIGGIIAGKLVDRNYAKTLQKQSSDSEGEGGLGGNSLNSFPIEAARYRHCLPFVFIQSLQIIGYGWAVHFRAHAAIPLTLQFSICGLAMLLNHTASALLVDVFPNESSSAYASGQIVRCALSAVLAAVLEPLVQTMGRGWYFTMLSLFVNVTGALSVLISRWKGMRWRRKRCGVV